MCVSSFTRVFSVLKFRQSHFFKLFHHSALIFLILSFLSFYFKSSWPERWRQRLKRFVWWIVDPQIKTCSFVWWCFPRNEFFRAFPRFYLWKFFSSSNFARVRTAVWICSIFDSANVSNKKWLAKYIVPEMCKVSVSDRRQLTFIPPVEIAVSPHFVAFFRKKSTKFRCSFRRSISIGSKR